MNLTPEQKVKYANDLKEYRRIANEFYEDEGMLPLRARIISRRLNKVIIEDTSGITMNIPVEELKWFRFGYDSMEVVNATIAADGKLIKSKVCLRLYCVCYDKSCREAGAFQVNQLILATLAYMAQQPDTYRKDWVQFLKKNWTKEPYLNTIIELISNKNYKMNTFLQLSPDNKDAILRWIYFMLPDAL